MPKDQQKQVRPRKRPPVSCSFCRTRKLRCSRTAPCSSCVTRDIACDLERPSTQLSTQPSSAPGSSENSEILERLHKLESLLITQKGEEQRLNGHPSRDAGSWPALVHPSVSQSQIQTLDADSDVAWLQSAKIDQILSSDIMRDDVVFRTCPIGQVTEAPSYIHQRAVDSITNVETSRCIWLPLRAEARILLEKFIRVGHYLPHITHISTLRSVVEQVYADLNQQCQIQLDKVVLLLGIFATATYSWTQSDCASGLFFTCEEANNQASLWIKVAENVLNIAYRSRRISIESVQGAVILGYVVAHLEGLHRFRALFITSIALAQDLGLHRIDHPSNADMANTARAEIGRRIWWYLCAMDWTIAARVGGMAEGIYSCHPRQMITRKPLNINDEEVFDGMSRDERPLSQPTTMSNAMQKIRLAEISRGIVDRSPLAMAHTGGLSHDAVMDIDTELQTLINDVPAFYSMSTSALMRTFGLTQTQAETFVYQGTTTYLLLYSQRCKIHLPYLARCHENPAYYSSREICIKHARLITQSELWRNNSDVDTSTRFKLTGALTGIFLACIVLLMDLCVNPLSPQYENQREDVRKSFRIIEEAKNESDTTANFVDSLIHILQKHNVVPLESVPIRQQQPAASNAGGSEQQLQGVPHKEMGFGIPDAPRDNEYGGVTSTRASQGEVEVSDDLSQPITPSRFLDEGTEDLSSYWNNFTWNFEQGIDVNSFDWDNVFFELDSSFV